MEYGVWSMGILDWKYITRLDTSGKTGQETWYTY